MARRPVGIVPQEQSLTAAVAFVASRLAGVGANRRDAWLNEAQIAIRRNGIERSRSRIDAAIRPWLLVDERRLGGLEKALVVFAGMGRARPSLLAALRATGAVRHLLITRSRRDVICIAVFDPAEKDGLFLELETFGEPFVWEDIVEDDRAIEADMWSALMLRCAEREGLADT